MDKDLPDFEIFSESSVEVGLSWKAIYIGGNGTNGGRSKSKSTTCGDKRDPSSTKIHLSLK